MQGAPAENWINVGLVAERLGVSEMTARRYADRGLFTVRRFPGTRGVRGLESDVDELMRGSVKPRRVEFD